MELSKNKLKCDFYRENAVDLSKKLLGKILVSVINGEITAGKIVETEAYYGVNDKGSHAYGGRKTERNLVMFKEGGIAYIYQIYGMYYCLNVVSGENQHPEAVLIRALEPIIGIDIMYKRRKLSRDKNIKLLTNGPGKLCIAMGLDKKSNGVSLCGEQLYIVDNNEKFDIVESKRINIDYAEEAKDFLWRFYIKGNGFVSKK